MSAATIMTTKKTERELAAIGKTQTEVAIKMADKESAELSATINEQMEAKEITESGAIRVLIALQKAYGQELAAFPRPGSTVETSDNPDVIKVERTNAAGNKTMVKSSWYVTFADNTREGKVLLQELAWIKNLRNTEADHNIVPIEFRNTYRNPEDWKVREGYLLGRRNTIRAAFKKAMALCWQFEDVNALKGVQVDFKWQDARKRDQVVNTKVPLRVSSVDNVDEWSYVSLSAFMRFDTAKAMENGGSYQALIDTAKRDSDGAGSKQGGDADAKPQLIRTADTFAARMTDIHEALSFAFTDKEGKKLHSDIAQALAGAGSDDLLLSLYDTDQAIRDLLKGEKIKARLEKLVQDREQEEKAA